MRLRPRSWLKAIVEVIETIADLGPLIRLVVRDKKVQEATKIIEETRDRLTR